jgi:hypothetical protein
MVNDCVGSIYHMKKFMHLLALIPAISVGQELVGTILDYLGDMTLGALIYILFFTEERYKFN